MKKRSKIKTIAKAFIEGRDVSEEIHHFRLDKCMGCEYLSTHTEDDKLNLIDRLRKKVGKEFCSVCGCYVEEKTGQGQEQCPLDDPKWLRVAVHIDNSNYFDLESVDYEKVSVDLKSDVYVVDLGEIDRTKPFKYKLRLKFSNNITDFKAISSCSICTNVLYRRLEGNVYELDVTMEHLSEGDINKRITIYYKHNRVDKQSTIKIEGNAKTI